MIFGRSFKTVHPPVIEPWTSDPTKPRPVWSVMIPNYHGTAFLGRALESVLEQDPGPDLMQIQVVDDASYLDDPADVIQSLAPDRVELYRQERNVGAPTNFTTCIRLSRGEWVHILHSDDFVMPNFYERYGQVIASCPDAAMVAGRTLLVDGDEKSLTVTRDAHTDGRYVRDAAYWMAAENAVQFVSAVVARVTYERVGGFLPNLFHTSDWEMWTRIAASGQIAWVDEALGAYRVHQDSDTRRLHGSTDYLDDCLRAVDAMCYHLADGPERRRMYRAARNRVAEYALDVGTTLIGAGEWRLATANALKAVRVQPSSRVRSAASQIVNNAVAGRTRLRRVISTVRDGPRRLAAIENAVANSAARLDGVQAQLSELTQAAQRARDDRDELLDSVHFTARATTLRRKRTRVLFLVHLIEAWDSYHDVVTEMQESDDFEPIVASIPRRFNGDTELGYEDAVHEGLEALGIDHLRLVPRSPAQALRLTKSIEPDLIFRQSQWDADIPDRLGTLHLGFARTCLIPYETMNIVENVPGDLGNDTAVDSPYHQGAWVIFCANQLAFELARRGSRQGAQFKVVGHPKADRLRQAPARWPIPKQPTGSRRPRVVWSAHHSIGQGWTDFGMFPLVADEMCEWAEHEPGIEFVFSPHPALVAHTHLASSPISAHDFERWLTRWNALANAKTWMGQGYAPLLQASDILISDGLSPLVDYQVLERPVVFLERQGHRPFNRIGEIVRRGVHPVNTVGHAREVVSGFVAGNPDPLAPVQRDNVKLLFGDQPSAPRVVSALSEMIGAERSGGVLPAYP